MSVFKRFTLFLVVIFSVSMAFAVNPYVWTPGTINGNAETEVFIDTTGTELCRVGFSTAMPTGYDTAPTPVSTDGIKLGWDETSNDGTAETTSDYYLYYQIKSGADIKIYMYGSGPLSGAAGNSDKVKWYVTVGREGGKSLTIDGSETTDDGETADRKLLIHEHLPSPATTSSTTDNSTWQTTTYGAYGGYKISIDTGDDSLWDKKADKYTSTLVVVIEAEGENAPTA